MFEILGVKRANYYKWLKHNKSERDLENEELADFIESMMRSSIIRLATE